MFKTFKGGLYIPENKNTQNLPIENFPSPKSVAVPIQQHTGSPAKLLIKKGEHVKKGQIIGGFENDISFNIHSPVSGTVIGIETRDIYDGCDKTPCIIIENDYSDELCETVKPFTGDILSASSEEIVEIIKKAGICDSIPTHSKIASSVGKVKEIIINCCESEPYITKNYRLMLECPEKIIKGALILMRVIGASRMTFAVENNKPDAVSIITDSLKSVKSASVKVLKPKYPQSDERRLVYIVKGIKLKAGKFPEDAGCVVFDAETCVSVYNAVFEGSPLIEKVLTIDGDAIERPCNLRIPIGTSISDIITYCGGVKENILKIINGGPMTGTTLWSYDSVVTKNTSALLFLSNNSKDNTEGNCIHCGKCIEVCPENLMPNYLASFSKTEDVDLLKKFNITSCTDCGCCAYICPGNVAIVQRIRTAKKLISEKGSKTEEKS